MKPLLRNNEKTPDMMQIVLRSLTAAALIVLLLTIATVVSRWSGHDPMELVAVIESRGPLPFFAAMTLLTLAGVPITIFYLAAGAAFEPMVNLTGTAAALMLNHLLAHVLGRRTLRPIVAHLLRKGRFRLPEPGPRGAVYTALVLKLTPGPPFFLRSYLMAVAGIPLKTFLLVSWPLSMAYAIPVILLGESAVEGRLGLAGLALGLMLVLGLLTALVRSRLSSHRARSRGIDDNDRS
jgi:uncharacterized membrane protein YdjX (TVP38/TMEM64 family)